MRGITVEETRGEGSGDYRLGAGDRSTLTLGYRWSSQRTAILLLATMSLGWDGAVACAACSGRFPYFMWFHLFVAVALSYMTCATIFNRTVIKASRTEITVRTGPVPLVAPVRVDALEVVSIEHETIVEHRRRRGSSVRHAVSAVMKSGARVRLFDAFTTPEAPTFLAEKLSLWLGCRARDGGQTGTRG